MVSTDLSSIGKASGHPVRWSIIVRMCLLPDVDVSHFVTKSMVILSNGLSGISFICSGYDWILAFSHQHNMQLAMFFQISFFIPFQLCWCLMRQ